MPDPDTSRIRDEAIAWHVRLAEADARQWTEFTRWLEADARHNEAYEAIADEDVLLEAALSAGEAGIAAANDDAPMGVGRLGSRTWHWPAIAAALVLVVGLALLVQQSGSNRYEIATVAGEIRTVAIDNGSSVTLNGDTRIELDRSNPRFAELAKGEARFNVRHYADAPFTVQIGAQRIVDVGTVFNVALDDDQLTVDVAEGAVRYDGYGQTFDIRAGATLTATIRGTVTLGEKMPTAMAGWMRGELVYRNARLSKVGRDLHRVIGVSITVSPDIADRSFSGVIQTGGSREELRARLASLLGVHVTETSDGWSFQP